MPVVLPVSSDSSRPASETLLVMVYDELRRLAARQMADLGNAGLTLQPTALVHEAWMRLTARSPGTWNNRSHFFRTAALAMRCILVDRARRNSSRKRYGTQVELEQADKVPNGPTEPDRHILAVDECLKRMEQDHPECARIVQLKFFAGLTNQETATLLGASLRSVERHWAFARARLYQMMGSPAPPRAPDA
jgi:RNA polymerase sigma factor (TIGR02999 family)